MTSCTGSGSNPKSHVAFTCVMFLVSFNLEPFLSLPLAFLVLTILKSRGNLLCK